MAGSRDKQGFSQNFDNPPLCLPISPQRRDEIEIISGTRPRDNKQDNVGLWLDKFVVRRPGAWTLTKDDRHDAFKRFCRRWESVWGMHGLARHEKTLDLLHGADLRWKAIGQQHGRLLVDFGRATATEVSISFHRTWGVPRIPGTALKGITRAQMEAEGDVDGRTLEILFGSAPGVEPLQPGCIAFYDALPVQGVFALDLDVLTPHHSSYYDGKGPPGEWEDPNPITFLSVVRTQFLFSIGFLPTPKAPKDSTQSQELTIDVGNALTRALEEAGVGAKTAAGYGRFKFKGMK